MRLTAGWVTLISDAAGQDDGAEGFDLAGIEAAHGAL
jgi:hypothetical protein